MFERKFRTFLRVSGLSFSSPISKVLSCWLGHDYFALAKHFLAERGFVDLPSFLVLRPPRCFPFAECHSASSRRQQPTVRPSFADCQSADSGRVHGHPPRRAVERRADPRCFRSQNARAPLLDPSDHLLAHLDLDLRRPTSQRPRYADAVPTPSRTSPRPFPPPQPSAVACNELCLVRVGGTLALLPTPPSLSFWLPQQGAVAAYTTSFPLVLGLGKRGGL